VDDETIVRALLERAGFAPPADDVDALVTSYARTREMVALLYRVEEARYESPALGFQVDPGQAEWW
jgi:hypothetical protein